VHGAWDLGRRALQKAPKAIQPSICCLQLAQPPQPHHACASSRLAGCQANNAPHKAQLSTARRTSLTESTPVHPPFLAAFPPTPLTLGGQACQRCHAPVPGLWGGAKPRAHVGHAKHLRGGHREQARGHREDVMMQQVSTSCFSFNGRLQGDITCIGCWALQACWSVVCAWLQPQPGWHPCRHPPGGPR